MFSETGLLVGLFLPGDSLLFTVGVVAGAGHLDIVLVNVVLMLAAMLGRFHRLLAGPQHRPAHLSAAPTRSLFKQEYIKRTQRAFTSAMAAKTIVMARFVPIVRTFAAFVAGVGQMRYRDSCRSVSSAASAGSSR